MTAQVVSLRMLPEGIKYLSHRRAYSQNRGQEKYMRGRNIRATVRGESFYISMYYAHFISFAVLPPIPAVASSLSRHEYENK